jgi:triacylglycerol lipase
MMNHLLVATLAAATSAAQSCDLPAGDIKDPRYWGDVFLDKYAAERAAATTQIEEGPPPLEEPRTVLLITGVTIPAEWFEPIVARLERDGFRPVVYEPPDLLSGDLFENSELLGEEIARIRAETGEDKIDILAECTGGLLARHYIQSLGGDQYVSRMVTFISPQHGLPKAAWAHDIVGWPALEDLTPGSDFLDAVNNAPMAPNVPVTSIYTCTDEYIQPYETSIIPGATNIGLGCDRFVGHYQFFYDPEIYLVMHDALTKPTGETPKTDGEDPVVPEAEDEEAGGCNAGGGAETGLLLMVGLALWRRRR